RRRRGPGERLPLRRRGARQVRLRRRRGLVDGGRHLRLPGGGRLASRCELLRQGRPQRLPLRAVRRPGLLENHPPARRRGPEQRGSRSFEARGHRAARRAPSAAAARHAPLRRHLLPGGDPMRSAGIRAAAPRAWPFVAAALLGGWLLAVTPEAHASSSSKLSLPSGPASIEGLGGSFTPSLASGTASYRVEIAVPPAAGGFAPALALEYDSGGGVSEVGLGWRLGGVPSIRRRTTEGLPTFTEADAFEAVGLGLPCDLVPVEGGFFRPEHEAGSFVRVQRSDDGSLWEARTKGGVTFRFGGDGFTEHEELNDATGDATSRVVTYLLREQLDRHGRRVAYEWDTEEGHALLT